MIRLAKKAAFRRSKGLLLARRRCSASHSFFAPTSHRPSAATTAALIGVSVRHSSSPAELSRRDSSSVSAKFSHATRDALLVATNQLISMPRNDLVKVTIEEFSAIMAGWSKQSAEENEREAADYAHSLLKILQANVDPQQGGDINNRLRPDTACYNFVLQAFAMKRRKADAEMAQAILEQMIARCRDYVSNDGLGDNFVPPEPSQLSFNIVMNAWAKTGLAEAGTKAEQVFSTMEDWYYECKEYDCFQGAAPNSRSVCGVMDAWAQSRSEVAAERVMAILQVVVERKKRQQQGDESLYGIVVTPVVIMFNSAIHACVHSNEGKVGAAKAEEVLAMLTELHRSQALGEVDVHDENDIGLAPSTRTFSLVMDAWARSEEKEENGEGARRAQKILENMIELYREGYPVKPNVVAFTTVAAAWTRCRGSADSAENAEAVLNMMLKLYQETGDEDLKPNEATANTVITAWARSGRPNASDRAESVLRNMEEYCQPNVITYNSVLNAYSSTGNFKKVMDVFRRLQGNKKIEADEISYNTIIHAAAKTQTLEGASKASQLLEEMESLYTNGNRRMQPSAYSYSAAINAWSKVRADDQVERARELFHRMLAAARTGNLAGTVDVIVFTTFITVCANLPKTASPDRQRDALKYAIESFELLQSDFGGRPNQFTYRMIMKCCQNLTNSRDECARLMEGLFRMCCNDGFVSNIELGMFRTSVPPHVLAKFSMTDRYSTVPTSWCRNVKPEFRPQTN
jgi:pentatricopeptide repeat protein